jgi:formamidopyrimidine-DNA glycosylase
MAGVGNIYANDALNFAGILPQRQASKLTRREAGKLLLAVRAVMERGLLTNGASDNSYLDAYGEKGAYQNEFLVYGKTKGKCLGCGKELSYGKVGGRGTWWCVSCQE